MFGEGCLQLAQTNLEQGKAPAGGLCIYLRVVLERLKKDRKMRCA